MKLAAVCHSVPMVEVGFPLDRIIVHRKVLVDFTKRDVAHIGILTKRFNYSRMSRQFRFNT